MWIRVSVANGDVPPRTTGSCGYGTIYAIVWFEMQVYFLRIFLFPISDMLGERFLFVFGGYHAYEEEDFYVDGLNNLLFR